MDKEIYSDYSQKGQTVRTEYDCNLMCQLKQTLKQREEVIKVVLYLQENLSAHSAGKMMDIVENLGFELYRNHPSCLPNNALSISKP